MEKVTINGKEYLLDVEECKAKGLLKDSNITWEEFTKLQVKQYNISGFNNGKIDWFIGQPKWWTMRTEDEVKAFAALGKLIQLRDYWWDNKCNGWRPGLIDRKHGIFAYDNHIDLTTHSRYNGILTFPTPEVRDEFYKTYNTLIEQAKMFL